MSLSVSEVRVSEPGAGVSRQSRRPGSEQSEGGQGGRQRRIVSSALYPAQVAFLGVCDLEKKMSFYLPFYLESILIDSGKKY